MKVGFIGLGIMGTPMAGHLIDGGHEAYLMSRSGVPKELLDKGGKACETARAVAEAAEIIITMVPDTPDAVLVPTGDGVISAGIAKGFRDLEEAGLIPSRPRLIAVQPEGSSAIVRALRSGADEAQAMPDATSVADSLNVEMPRNAIGCLAEVRASNGGGVEVSDDAILEAIPRLASATGVFAEPAGAAALAGLEAALDEGLVDRDERVVLMVTGGGLKDITAAAQAVPAPDPVEPTLEAVAERILNS